MNDVAIKGQMTPKLSPGQLALYMLFCNSVADKKVLSRAELFAVYKQYVATGKSDKPRRGEGGGTVWVLCAWTEWEWQHNFDCWFIYTLGALLKKGCLRVVPAIDLSKFDLGQLQNNV